MAAARSDTLTDIRLFYRLLGGVLEELNVHKGYAASLGIDLKNVAPLPQTLAYTEFLSEIVWRSQLGELIAAMTPCMRLYAFLGARLAQGGIPNHQYREWIGTYSSTEFEALAASLEEALDRLASDTPSVHKAYAHAMRLELTFFDASLCA